MIKPSIATPVITIDGPTASGKGTIAQRVALALGWHVLDSGALYRLAAWAVLDRNADANDIDQVALLARRMDVTFAGPQTFMSGKDVTEMIRQEHVGDLASRLAPHPALREALLDRQRAFRENPGLVADGRDMGTVVFPDAPLKVFLTADVHARSARRCHQLRERGECPDEQAVFLDLQKRDERDMQRTVAPLKPADDAHALDSSALTVEQTVEHVLELWRVSLAKAKHLL
ncbi:MAG: (d)CMP kinase [Orrella sp.]|jgi:CMP/dCMP kinase|uniref:(d)CMP kinase n=1 Tax=Orrella sp. TaxID=1921583 RepID=UPI003BE625B8